MGSEEDGWGKLIIINKKLNKTIILSSNTDNYKTFY